MNSISWFLYLADVVNRVSSLSGFVAFMGIFAAATATGLIIAFNADNRKYNKPEEIWGPKYVIAIWTLWTFITFIAIFTPSKDTLYLIAGSEVAETVVTTPEAKEILDETRKAILSQIKALQK